MNFQFSDSEPKLDKAMTSEQFNQIVEAILAGKYSWACVLILRFAGYNPLHYIPYTTYIRLNKENQQEIAYNKPNILKTKQKHHSRTLSQLSELDRLETIEEGGVTIQGGSQLRWQHERIKDDYLSFNFKNKDKFLSPIELIDLTHQNNIN